MLMPKAATTKLGVLRNIDGDGNLESSRDECIIGIKKQRCILEMLFKGLHTNAKM